jgi:hypothetical protein
LPLAAAATLLAVALVAAAEDDPNAPRCHIEKPDELSYDKAQDAQFLVDLGAAQEFTVDCFSGSELKQLTWSISRLRADFTGEILAENSTSPSALGPYGGTYVFKVPFLTPGPQFLAMRVESAGNRTFLPTVYTIVHSPPDCHIKAPRDGNLRLAVGGSQSFEVECTDADGDLSEVVWYVNNKEYQRSPLAGGNPRDHVFSLNITFSKAGPQNVQAIASDARKNRDQDDTLLVWKAEVGSLGGQPEDPAGGGLDGGTAATLGGAAAATGGGAYGAVRYRKAKRAKATANVGAAVNKGNMAASESGTAVGTNSGMVAHGNSGTVISNTGTLIMQGPPPAHLPVPSGVPPRRHALYQALEDARDVLDAPEAGAAVVNARDMVADMLGDLREGKSPLAGQRQAIAEAIGRAAQAQVPRIQEGAAMLQQAMEELRK